MRARVDPQWLPEEYADFIARIKQDLNPIEAMRNAVAHNRTPSARETANYETARAGLLAAIDNFLEERGTADDSGEPASAP